MKLSVRAAFVDFTVPMEGLVRHLYADVKNLITVAIGNLVDPMPMALGLPFVRPDGSRATQDEIAADWHRIKSDPNCAKLGHRYAARLTSLRLTDEGIDALVMGKLDENDKFLLKRFPDFEQWPADAQLATHSMAWACGPAFRFPKLEAALRAQDFVAAAVECRMDERGNPGLRPRNKVNKQLYRNAVNVLERGLDPEALYLPRDLDKEPRELEMTPFEVVTVMPDTVQRCVECGLVSCERH